jgi:hypothetical protein
MADWLFFNSFMEDTPEKVHNLGSDTLKIALSNTLPDRATDTQLSDITQITNAGGYAAATVTVSTSAQSGGTYSLTHAAVTFTPSGAAFDSARYWVLYNDTATNDKLIGYLDYGISYATPDGQPWTLNAGTIMTLAQSA